MSMLHKTLLSAFGVLALLSISWLSSPRANAGGMRSGVRADPASNAPRTIAPYFLPIATPTKTPDEDGFLQRWLLLEPIDIGINSNAGLTETYVRNTILKNYVFPDQLTVFPKDGDTTSANNVPLAWHALDSSAYNVKLFRFAYGLDKKAYGALYWFVTQVQSPVDQPNVRLAVGSNSASIWWVNGTEVIAIYGDKHMIVDDGVSKRLTLKKGKNIVRGAIVNGPGLSDFCARFINDNGDPIKNLTLNLAEK